MLLEARQPITAIILLFLFNKISFIKIFLFYFI